jgi:beta-glucosidase
MTRFPDNFLWGAATSAYQVEGSPLADGAGMSHWHRFAHTPGNTANGETGDVACDHYRRWREDVELMKSLGLTAYRFSLAWARILPEGRGRVNQAGMDFYSGLVDALLAAGIQPMVTLYHWDLPAALDDRGGWLNPECVEWFADYASIAFETLGDRVPLWATINEPWVITDGGYLFGALAPGHRNLYEAPIVSHHLLKAHGAAVRRFRASGARGAIGLVVDLAPKDPASDSAADRAATTRSDAYKNRQYLDPVFRGEHPPEMKEIFGDAWPALPADDPLIREPFDWLGINYYTRNVMRHDDALPLRGEPVEVPGAVYTVTGWEIYPEGLTRILLWVKERYGALPLYVTENGCALTDVVSAPGRIEDPVRVRYLADHLRAVRKAIDAGVDVRGYFAWSLFDNYEWSSGYAMRFGLVHVDFKTQKRTIKASGEFYREVIRTHGETLDQPRVPAT